MLSKAGGGGPVAECVVADPRDFQGRLGSGSGTSGRRREGAKVKRSVRMDSLAVMGNQMYAHSMILSLHVSFRFRE